MFRDTHTVPSADGVLRFMGLKSEEESTRGGRDETRASLTLRSTSAHQTAKRREDAGERGERGEQGGKREKRFKLDYHRVRLQNNNFSRHFTAERVRYNRKGVQCKVKQVLSE